MENKDSSALETNYEEGDYSAAQCPYEPSFAWSLGDQEILPGEDTHCYKNEEKIQIQFLKNQSFTLDATVIPTAIKYGGKTLTPEISCKNSYGVLQPVTTDGKVTFTSAGTYSLIYTYQDEAVYGADGNKSTKAFVKTIPVVINVKKGSKQAEIELLSNTGDIEFKKGTYSDGGTTSGRGDFGPCAPALSTIKIIDYDVSGTSIKVLDGTNQADFINRIAKIESDADGRTGYTIYLVNGTKLHITCTEPYHREGRLKFLKKDNIFYMAGTKFVSASTSNLGKTTITWKVTKYEYTGLNGQTVTLNETCTFSKLVEQNGYASGTFNEISSAKSLIYILDGGDMPDNVEEYTTTSPATLPLPTRDDYSFLNWNTKADGTGTKYNAGDSYSFSSLTYLYAQWYVPYVVKFNANGGDCETKSLTFNGVNVTLPTPTRNGYWFTGWYDAADEGNKIGDAGSTIVPTDNITLYAHWSPEYTITYNANGGTVSTLNATYKGTALTLPTASNGNYPFEGWYTEAEGGEKIGAQGDSYVPEKNITLFAHWGEPTTVTYNANADDANVEPTSESYTNTALTLPVPTRSGYWCTGWYDDPTGGVLIKEAGATGYIPESSITLYAHWSPEYTVTYDTNSGSVSPASAIYKGTALSLPTPTRTGYTFNGWYTAASGGTKVGNGGASYKPTADITLYAQWTIKSYKVTITTSSSSTDVTVNGTTVNSGGNVAYNSVVKVVLSYTQTSSLTFTIKQGSTNVTYYSNEACTSSTTSTATGTYYFKMPAGDVTINSSSSAGSCVAAGTLVTLADGTNIPIEQLTGEEELLVWNLETGNYDTAPIVFVDSDPEEEYEVITLTFYDGTNVDVISEHGFFDVDLGKYIYLDADAADYIGHRFARSGENGDVVTLTDVDIHNEVTSAWSPVTYGHLCYYVNGMLSMPGGIDGLFNIFDVDTDTMKYDQTSMTRDVAEYGLFTYEDFMDYVSEEAFGAFNGAYLKVAMGKGLITWEDIAYLAERYMPLVGE